MNSESTHHIATGWPDGRGYVPKRIIAQKIKSGEMVARTLEGNPVAWTYFVKFRKRTKFHPNDIVGSGGKLSRIMANEMRAKIEQLRSNTERQIQSGIRCREHSPQ